MGEPNYWGMSLAARQIGIQLELRANEALSEEELTAPQAQVLLYILDRGELGTSLTELQGVIGYSKGTLSAVVKRLRQMGYVRCEPCAEDDRRKRLFATEKSWRAGPGLREAFRRAEERCYRGLSPEELLALEQLQQKVLRNLNKNAPNGGKEGTKP